MTIQSAPGSGTVSPTWHCASAARIDSAAAARSATGWPSSARLAGPMPRAASTAASSPRPLARLEAPEPADKHQHEPESALQERGVAAAVGSASTHVPPSRQLFDQLAQQYDRQATNQIVQINAEMRRRQIAPLLPGSPRI